MNIDLTVQECDELLHLLERELVALPVEIHRTEARDYRRELERREDVLRGLRDRLSVPAAT